MVFNIERKIEKLGKRFIAGIDEVGRGPLAGNVVCCAVIMPLEENLIIEGVKDSKRLTAKKREFLADEIKRIAIDYAIAEISHQEIDRLNILQATKKCMQKAVYHLKIKPDYLLIDGNFLIESDIEQTCIVHGDSKSYSIAAASILAKVHRDAQMIKLAEEYPNYGFEQHKGYGTKMHIEAIRKYGICNIHRKTFTKKFWDN